MYIYLSLSIPCAVSVDESENKFEQSFIWLKMNIFHNVPSFEGFDWLRALSTIDRDSSENWWTEGFIVQVSGSMIMLFWMMVVSDCRTSGSSFNESERKNGRYRIIYDIHHIPTFVKPWLFLSFPTTQLAFWFTIKMKKQYFWILFVYIHVY